MADVDCFTAHGRKDLGDEFKKHLDAGIPEKEAARKVILDEHERIFNDLNKLKEKIKVSTEAYIRPDNSEQIKSINDEYDKKNAEVPVETKTPITEPTEVNQTIKGAEPEIEGESKNPNTVGVSHEALTSLAKKLGLPEPERGEYTTPEEYAERGSKLLKGGADPNEIDNPKNELHDRISIGRAHLEDLVNEMNKIGDKKGEDSKEFEDVQNKVSDYAKKVKKLGTAAHRAFVSMQGERDLDTGSFTAIKNAKAEATGQAVTSLPTDIQDLSRKVKSLEIANEKLQQQLKDALDKAADKTDKTTNIKDKAKKIAENIRKLKSSRPDTFSAATPASLVWDGAIEVAAKTVEAGGSLLQAISDGIDHIKESKWYKELDDEKKKTAEQDFESSLKGSNDLMTQFVDKKDNKFTPEESKEIWGYAKKTYIDNNPNFKVVDMVNKIAIDLGLTPEQVRHALGQTGETKTITNQIYRNQYEKNRAHQTIQRWVNKSKDNKVERMFNFIASPFRGLATLGHGHALLFTHAGMNLFDPKVAKTFFTLAAKQFKIVYGKEELYEQAVNDLKNDPLYTTAVRSGLAVNPDTIYDDWQIANNFLKKLKIQGNKGFLVLKMLRMEMFKSEYSKLSEIEKNDKESVKNIAQIANHWTGTAGLKVSPSANAFIFAPNLIVSKFARLTTDPAKALATLANWNKSSIAERAAAKVILKKSGRIAAMYLVGLAGNQALLSLTGSNQSINFTNPFKSDWLKFKAGNHTVDVTSGMASTLQFLTQLGALPFENKKDVKENYYGATSAGDAAKGLMWGELRKIASPFGSTVLDVATHTDFAGNVVPWSNDKPRSGRVKLTPLDYFMEKAPIPFSEGYRTVAEQMRQEGVSTPTIMNILNGTLIAALGSAGIKIGNEPKEPVQKTITIKDPDTFKERNATPEEQKKYEDLRDKKFPQILDDYMKGREDMYIDVNGKIHTSKVGHSDAETATWEYIEAKKLSDGQFKEFEKSIREKSSNQSKKELFGSEQ